MSHDPIGHQTLEIMAQADHYNKWIYSLIKPYMKGEICEVGAGIGTFSGIFCRDGFSVTAVDYYDEYLKIITQKNKKIKTFLFDMQSKSFPVALSGKFDTIVILNVLEHLSDHALAMAHLNKMLKSDGMLIILVPSFQLAFGSLDKYLGHFRRYTKKSFARLAVSNGFKIISSQYINFLGLWGWFINARLFKLKSISNFQVRIFNFISKPFLLIEKYISPPMGLSLICVAAKL